MYLTYIIGMNDDCTSTTRLVWYGGTSTIPCPICMYVCMYSRWVLCGSDEVVIVAANRSFFAVEMEIVRGRPF